MTKRRQNKFIDEFANAIDVIVRGVKSGLPLIECLGIIAREAPQPIARGVHRAGRAAARRRAAGRGFERMMTRMPLPEVRFFAIVIAIQQQAGGNLSEALGNLSGVLRDRKRLQAKVRALSAEAKASAARARRAAVRRHDPRLHHHARPTSPCSGPRRCGQFLLVVRRALDDDAASW